MSCNDLKSKNKYEIENCKTNVNASDYWDWTPLKRAVRWRKRDAARYLLNRPDIEVNKQDDNGRTPLMDAVMNDDVEMVRLLLNHPVINPSVTDNDGKDAAFYAKIINDPELTGLLENLVRESNSQADSGLSTFEDLATFLLNETERNSQRAVEQQAKIQP